jgi:hypothetical protein
MKKKTKKIEMKRVRGGVPVRSAVKAGVKGGQWNGRQWKVS